MGTGSGVAATGARSLPSFTGVELAGDNNVIVQVGVRQAVVVHADSNLSPKTPMFVAVGLPPLDDLACEATSSTHCENLRKRRLERVDEGWVAALRARLG